MILPKTIIMHFFYCLLGAIVVFLELNSERGSGLMFLLNAKYGVTACYVVSIMFTVIISIGYIVVGYWINDGYMKGIKPTLLIFSLSICLFALNLLGQIVTKNMMLIQISSMLNLSYMPLLGVFQSVFNGKYDTSIMLVTSLLPSLFIYLGYIFKINSIA